MVYYWFVKFYSMTTLPSVYSFYSCWTFGYFQFGGDMNKAAINLYISFGEYIHSFLLATFLGVELLDHWRGVFFTLVDTVRFPKG